MTVFKRQRSDAAEVSKKAGRQAASIETYPTESVFAAGRMASKQGDNTQERANYARILVEESRALSAYISSKSSTLLKRTG